jgi:hypothetical protein
LPPIKKGREFHAFNAVLDTKSQKHAVEMGLDRAFCDLQIARDFRVVTSLEQKINDLLLPAPQAAERFFHVLHLTAAQVPPTRLVD